MSQGPLDKLKNVDWRGLVKSASNKVKQYTLNLSPLEIQVEDATNDETWGPHGSVMTGIADACFDPEGYRQVFGILARRLQETDTQWRRAYKALLLLEFLVKQGPPKVADDVLASISVLERLQRFEYKDPNGRDHGANVRHRAQEIAQLVSDPNRVREERAIAAKNKTKYTGVSGADMRGGGGGGGGGYGNSGGGGGRSFGASSNNNSGRFDPASLVRPGGSTSTSGASGPQRNYGGFSGQGGSSSSNTYTRRDGTTSSGYTNDAGMSTRPSYSPRNAASGGGGGGASTPAAAAQAVSRDDALDATRARIEKLKMEQGTAGRVAAAGGDEKPAAPVKKKLTDVKINPKIAMSLGLRPVAAVPKHSPAAAAATSAAAVAASPSPTPVAAPAMDAIDLLGGLDDDNDAPAAVDFLNGGGGGDGGWDAFGDVSSSQPPPPPPATTSTPLEDLLADAPSDASQNVSNSDFLGGGGGDGGWDAFGSTTTTTTAADTTTTTTAELDFFGATAAPIAPTTTTTNTTTALPSSSPAHPQISSSPPKAAQPPSRAALPEDIFAGLTGLSKPVAPMMGSAHKKSPVSASPAATSTAAAAAADPFGGGFADFNTAASVAVAAPVSTTTSSSFVVPPVAQHPVSTPPVAPLGANKPSNDPFGDLFA